MSTPAVITLVPVVSSNIAAIGYHAPSRTLEVQFKNGSRYQYQNVMVPDYEALIHADSIGSWFSQKIKALPETFPCTKVSGPTGEKPDVTRFDAVADGLVRNAKTYAEQAREHRQLCRTASATTACNAVRGVALHLLASDLDPATWLGEMRALLQELATWA